MSNRGYDTRHRSENNFLILLFWLKSNCSTCVTECPVYCICIKKNRYKNNFYPIWILKL